MSTHFVCNVTVNNRSPSRLNTNIWTPFAALLKQIFCCCYCLCFGYFFWANIESIANCQRQIMKIASSIGTLKISNEMYMFIVYGCYFHSKYKRNVRRRKNENKTTLHSVPLIYSIFFAYLLSNYIRKKKTILFSLNETNGTFFYGMKMNQIESEKKMMTNY